ncbi:parapinopsin a [Paralichthys olivaceus]|uniref:Parapinopsin n=1 Tax=Paralichthys olivaceus TaxID=8255 RepID=A0A4P2TKM8_PAROL|nr:PREDICTED: parapinopsin-like [Paralichthys olivaceus]AXF38084.1 parapinopsin [Paralichthys olivaceus]
METVALQRNSSSSHSSDDAELLSQTGFTILAVIMGVFSVAGIILNVLVVVVTVRHRQLRQPLSYALVNLAICDLGCAVFGGLPTTMTSAMGYFSLGRVGCVLEGFAVAFFGIASLCTIGVISVERYIVVCYPMGAVLFQTRHAVAGVVLSWVWSFVWNTPPLFGWGSYELEGIKTSCAPNWYNRDVGNMSYIIMYFFLCFAIPFSIITVSYSRLLWTLRQVTKLQVSEAGRTNRVEVQVARMVVVMVLAFLVTWLPYAAMASAVIIDPNFYIDPVIATIPVYLAKSSTVYNPIIYVFMNRQFRAYAVPTILCGWNPWASDPQMSEGETTVATLNKSQKVSSKQSLKE